MVKYESKRKHKKENKRAGLATMAGQRRLRAVAGHLSREEAKGEEQHPVADDQLDPLRLFRFKYDRRPIKIVVRPKDGGGGVSDKYAGIQGVYMLEGELLVPSSTSAAVSTVTVFMHPSATMNGLPMAVGLARAGCHVLLCGSRYAGSDASLLMEKCVVDLGIFIKHCREKLGYDRVVLGGWSGGGSLSTYYQAQATLDSGDRVHMPVDLGKEELPQADALLLLAAHASRARILTECLDPSIWLFRRDDPQQGAITSLREFNLYGDAPSPPYTPEYLVRFREAQVARSLRITEWARRECAAGRPGTPFVLEGTMADPRWLDGTVDPNDRGAARWCYLGDPEVANDMPTGLARFCTAQSWLSQWSLHDSQADGVAQIQHVRVPVLVVENGADNGCPTPHPRDVYTACAASDKTYITIRNAKHYYDGQIKELAEACTAVVRWLNNHKFTSIALGNERLDMEDAEVPVVETGSEAEGLARAYRGDPSMEIRGVNHLALVSSDMERTCAFYSGVLGLRLAKTIKFPDGGQHFFFDLNDGNSLAFFFFPDAAPANPGVAAPSLQQMIRKQKHPSAQGSMNHVAFNVPESRLKEYRRRLIASNMSPFVTPIVYHADNEDGMSTDPADPTITFASVYFFGPDGELLELTAQRRPFISAADVTNPPRPALWRAA